MKVITFLSDFGLTDGYVGSVKGAIFSSFPEARIIDITHDIKPFQIEEAAYTLMSYYSFYPKDTVHLTVVDPGVGGKRAPLIIKTANYYFVGPDNGLFSYIFQKEAYTAFEINTAMFDSTISATFHGRDIFAPVAAKLARGVKPELLGNPFKEKPEDFAKHISDKQQEFEAKIISVDRFGNIITDFSMFEYDAQSTKRVKGIEINNQILKTIKRTYSDVKNGELLALWGSAGFLEISVNKGNAAEHLKCKVGDNNIRIKF
jgi:S-adenosyl-L-methionine hydrolase (adenosine-forming)